MNDLETAATQALAVAKVLHEKADDATERIRHLRGSIEAIDQQCDTTWKRFEEMIDALRQETHDKTEELDLAGHEARQAVDGARAQVEGHAPLVEQALEHAQEGAQTLREHIQQAETEVMPLVDDLETIARAAIDTAHKARTELDAAVAEAKLFMEDEAVDALRQMQDAVRQRTAEWRTALQHEHREPAEADQVDWSVKLAEVEGAVEESFAGAVQHADEVARFVTEKLKAACDDALAELERLTNPLVAELEELKSQADSRRGEAGKAGDDLESDVRETIDVLDDATGKLLEIAVEFAKFYFTGM
jgi:hypothetical protein